MARMPRMILTTALTLFAVALAACGWQDIAPDSAHEAPPQQPKFATAISGGMLEFIYLKGHSELSRYAVALTNELAATAGRQPPYAAIGLWDHVSLLGDDKLAMVSPLYRGNYTTDFPLTMFYQGAMTTGTMQANLLNHDLLLTFGFCADGYRQGALGGAACQANFSFADKGFFASDDFFQPTYGPMAGAILEPISSPVPYQESGHTQSLHFLRNFRDFKYNPRPQQPTVVPGDVAPFLTACAEGRAHIRQASHYALSYFFRRHDDSDYQNRQTKAREWLGVALHTIQDSFSTEHVARSPDFRTIANICTFSIAVPGVCSHKSVHYKASESGVLAGDRIWRDLPGCLDQEAGYTNMKGYYDSRSADPFRKFRCLKPEARHAVYASVGYLQLMQELLAQADDFVKEYPAARSRMGFGAFIAQVAEPRLQHFLQAPRRAASEPALASLVTPAGKLLVTTTIASAQDPEMAGVAKTQREDLFAGMTVSEQQQILTELGDHGGSGYFRCRGEPESAAIGSDYQAYDFATAYERFYTVSGTW